SAHQAGVVTGSDGKFHPEDPVTREQMVTMFMRALGSNAAIEVLAGWFADDELISDWAREHVYRAYSLGLIQGAGGNLFLPDQHSTRGDLSVFIYRYVKSTLQ